MLPIRVGLVTKEWPPYVYGGAGVHVVQLAQALRARSDISLSVHCFGLPRTDAIGYAVPTEFGASNLAIQAVATDLAIADALSNVDVVHTHTWYANMAGHVASLIHGIPHIMSAHSLEPLRPWKVEQLGGGYHISSWVEKSAIESAAAIIAVSDAMHTDVLASYPDVDPAKVHTIRNGVDAEKFSPHHDPSVLAKYKITGRYALFVGRITRQKGLVHLLRAWQDVPPEFGLVIAAGSPDEPAVGEEITELITRLQGTRKNVWWIEKMLSHAELTAIITAADLFICPSIYEPLGIVNLEAMGCATAVLASAVGGIPEVVSHGVTGELVNYSMDKRPFEGDLTNSIVKLMSQPELLRQYGVAGRVRVQSKFGWDEVATATMALYESVVR